jgi:glycosyltransferase involved in cell wall biosynthesis
VLLLSPSEGLGGGIERYTAAIEAVLDRKDVPCRRLNLRHADQPLTGGSRLQFVQTARRIVRTSDGPVRLVIAHANLLPVLAFTARQPAFGGAVVIMHGGEIWSGRSLRGRRWLRRRDVRVVAASNFSAGALARTCRSNVVPPGIAPEWYETLVRASVLARPPDRELHLITAFRLGSWHGKGLDTILQAVELVGPDRIRLTICGTGPVTAALRARTVRHPWCRVVPDLTDVELADQLARADVFVLATRTRDGVNASGEGFGLVLLEAQLAGTPVIAPAFGGGGDAFQPGVTGLSPIDETPQALAVEIAELLDNEKRRREMSEAAAAWSRTRFEPETYGKQLIRAILG